MRTLELVGTRGRYADIALALFVMLTVGMMIVPLPTFVLDLLIASNLALSALLLLTALYVPKGLGFSTLPTLLLISTLYRLSLNVSSTRLILLQADAGHVIQAFGDFVVRGNYVVGGVVFVMLTIIQYVVVAKGAERIAEVGARFTLDAMPGKQLAIDSDLRAGALSVESARQRRAMLERESHFYGAMDGAMKFVKGDAIAGIAIAVISLLGGTAIGVGMQGLPFAQSLRTYGLLTIGDGLVSQIPSLVISTAAALVVTRVASHAEQSSLGDDIAEQLFSDPRVLGAGALFLLLLSIVPGLPALPFLVLGVLLAAFARGRMLARAAVAVRAAQAVATQPSAFDLQLGSALASRWLQPRESASLQRLCAEHARALEASLGVQLPAPRILANPQLDPHHYALVFRELTVHREPVNDAVRLPDTLGACLSTLLPSRARELLDLEDVRRALDTLAEQSPTLVRSMVPQPLSISTLTDVLRRLLDEGVSVRPLSRILEALASAVRDATGSAPELTERARRALRELIVAQAMHEGVLRVHRIDPMIEDALRSAHALGVQTQAPALPADMAQDVIDAVRAAIGKTTARSVLITQPALRRALFELVAPELPGLRVLSYAELPPSVSIEEAGAIRV